MRNGKIPGECEDEKSAETGNEEALGKELISRDSIWFDYAKLQCTQPGLSEICKL